MVRLAKGVNWGSGRLHRDHGGCEVGGMGVAVVMFAMV